MSIPDTPTEHNDRIRVGCAEIFRTIEGRLSTIETTLKAIRENQRTWGHRLWGVAKAIGLLLFGWFLSGKITNGKG